MSITNQDKPQSGRPQTYLEIGSTFNLLIGNLHKLIIGPANLLAGLTNSAKVAQGETWASITSTWATETQSWLAVSQLIGNIAKPTSSITNASKP